MAKFSWSYTRLRDWENCARAYEWRHIKRNVEPETDDLRWGNAVHSALADRAKGVPLPGAMEQFEKYGDAIDRAREAGMTPTAETQYALTRQLKKTEWMAPDVYVRAILDLTLVKDDHALIVDWKTGKKRDDDTQLKLFAGFAFALWPLRTVETRYVWLKGAPPSVKTYTREDSPWIWSDLLPRAERMEKGIELKQFDPRPSGLCAWCPVKTCEHNRKK